MAISLVHASAQAFTTSGGTTLAIPVTTTGTGNSMVVGVLHAETGLTVSGVADDATGGTSTYAQVSGSRATTTSDNTATDIWYAKVLKPGATTVTVTLSASGAAVIVGTAFEVAGLDTTANAETSGVTNNGTESGGVATGPTLTTSATSSFILAYGDDPNGFNAINSPWTLQDNASGYVITGSAGNYQPVFTGTGTDAYCISAAAFKVAAASFVPDEDSWQNNIVLPPDRPVTVWQ